MSKVIKIEENDLNIDVSKLMGSLMLKEANPIASIPFVAKGEIDLIREKLCKKANFDSRDDGIYINNILITEEMQKYIISEELVKLAEFELNNDNNDLYLGNMVKSILKDITLKSVDKDKFLLTEADLIKGLYGINEEEVSKSL